MGLAQDKAGFDIREPSYYQSGNTFTGSRQGFRFLIRMEEGRFLAFAWWGEQCFEKAQPQVRAQFEGTAAGFQELQDWLLGQERELAPGAAGAVG